MTADHVFTGQGTWPYIVTFAWTFIEGESFVLFAGFAASQGLVSAPLLVASACLGSFAGDQCYFWIARRFGLSLLAKRPRWRARVDQALDWVRRYDAWFILAFRFIYGVRNFSSFALGISGIDWRRFMIFNFIAALVWAATFVGTGYVSGRAVHRLLGTYAERFSLSLLGCVAAILICVFLVRWVRRRLDAKSGKIPSAASP